MNIIRDHLLNKLKEHLKNYGEKDLYSVCTSSYFLKRFYDVKTNEMYSLLKEAFRCDSKLLVPKVVGRSIEELFENEELSVGIYRTVIEEGRLQSDKVGILLSEGIPASNQSYYLPSLSKTIMFPKNIIEAMNMLKETTGKPKIDFIIVFPKGLTDKNIESNVDAFKAIYEMKDNRVYIKPDYIDSYVTTNQGVMNRIKKNEFKQNAIKK